MYYHDPELLFHIKQKLNNATLNFQTVLNDPTEEKKSELIISNNNENKDFLLDSVHDVLKNVRNYKEEFLNNASIELSEEEQKNHFLLYQNDCPVMTLSFKNEDLHVTCLDFKLLNVIEDNHLIKKLDIALLRTEDCIRYNFASCIIYKNANQISNLYEILINAMDDQYYPSNSLKDAKEIAKQQLFALSMKNFLHLELRKLNNLLQKISYNPQHLLAKNLKILLQTIEIFNFLYNSNLFLIKKKNKIPVLYSKHLQNAFTYQDEFDHVPSIIMNSFVNLNKRFRGFTVIFLKDS